MIHGQKDEVVPVYFSKLVLSCLKKQKEDINH